MILKEYFKPHYAREIRDAIIAGDDPKLLFDYRHYEPNLD